MNVNRLTTRHVFVYGTLRRGEERDINQLVPAPQFVGEGAIPGVMYDLGTYPGVVLGPGAVVVGEIYAIDPELELLLDEIEDVAPQPSGEYSKQQVSVMIGPRRIPCLVYEVSLSLVRDKPRIISGDWCKRGLRSGT